MYSDALMVSFSTVERKLGAVHDPDYIDLVALPRALAVIPVAFPQDHAVHVALLRARGRSVLLMRLDCQHSHMHVTYKVLGCSAP